MLSNSFHFIIEVTKKQNEIKNGMTMDRESQTRQEMINNKPVFKKNNACFKTPKKDVKWASKLEISQKFIRKEHIIDTLLSLLSYFWIKYLNK